VDVSVVVATYGDAQWRRLGDLAANEADGAPVIRVHGNGDLAGARNEGLAQVFTEWVCFLDGDDALAPGYFWSMNQGSADVRQPSVSGWCDTTMVPICTADHISGAHTAQRDCLQFGNPLCIGAVVKTALVRAVGGFDSRWPVVEDYALWRAIAINGASFEAIPAATYIARARRNLDPRNRIGGRRLRAATHAAIDEALPWR